MSAPGDLIVGHGPCAVLVAASFTSDDFAALRDELIELRTERAELGRWRRAYARASRLRTVDEVLDHFDAVVGGADVNSGTVPRCACNTGGGSICRTGLEVVEP